ncbi:hypothetical protein BDV06DRAFT_202044 [Aspergillus oleicola]
MAICLDRDGNQDITRFPCSGNGNPAQCCEDCEVCATNGLCGAIRDLEGLTLWQNTCTVPDWINGTVETCPTQCAHFANAGNGVQVCGNERFCCIGFEGCDCDNSTQVFSLPAVRITATITAPSDSSSTTSASQSSSSAKTTSTSFPTHLQPNQEQKKPSPRTTTQALVSAQDSVLEFL